MTLSGFTLLFALGAPSAAAFQSTDFEGAVYVMTNEFDGNEVVAYGRAADGTLTPIGSSPTGCLRSQTAVVDCPKVLVYSFAKLTLGGL